MPSRVDRSEEKERGNTRRILRIKKAEKEKKKNMYGLAMMGLS